MNKDLVNIPLSQFGRSMIVIATKGMDEKEEKLDM